MKYVGIIPLIGGMDLAHGAVLGHRPEYIVSWGPFAANDSHLLNYYEYQGEPVKYVVVDDPRGKKRPRGKIDIVHSTCPCAGLSMLSKTAGADNPLNEWMLTCAEYVMGEIKPAVYWGENAPALASKMGETIREGLRAIGKKHGYVMSMYRTKSLLHGVPQIRERSFYFFWRGSSAPLFRFFDVEHDKIEEVIAGARGNSQQEPVSDKVPSEDPYYRYVLEEVNGGMSHVEFAKTVKKTSQMLDLIERETDYHKLGRWMKKKGYEREAAFCDRTAAKLEAGGGIMRRSLIIPKDYIGAFVGHLPTAMVHPYEDRHLTYRECMTIMGLPDDFELLKPKRQLNHVCQNVPFQTAADMAREVASALSGERQWVRTDYLFQNNRSKSHEAIDDPPDTKIVEEMFA